MAELSLCTVIVLLSIIVIAAMIAGASIFSMCTTRHCKPCHRRTQRHRGGYMPMSQADQMRPANPMPPPRKVRGWP